jgi:hypothetical protein
MVRPRDKRFPAISNSPPSDVTPPHSPSLPSLPFPPIVLLNHELPHPRSLPLTLNIPTLPSTFSPSSQCLDRFFFEPHSYAPLSRARLDSRTGLAWPLPTTVHLTIAYTRSTSVYAIVPSPRSLRFSFFFFLFRMRRAFPFSTHWNNPLPH